MDDAKVASTSLTGRTIEAGLRALRDKCRGPRCLVPFTGPAVVASVAYMDPGNFATNIQAGAKYNYDLLWVVLLAGLIAMLFQSLSAKLGIVTGRNLAELSREHFPQPVVWGMWVASEIAAMATDLAEFLGAAVGLSLVFAMPMMASMAITAVASCAVLTLQRHGFRPIELVIGLLVGVIGASYLVELLIVPTDWASAAVHSFVPRLHDGDALTLTVGIVGATVMPHALYLHSGLTQNRIVPRNEGERRKLLRFSNQEVVLALGLAGLVNMAMVAMAAAVFHDGVHDGIAELDTAYHTLMPLMGFGAAGVFLLALIVSGLSSSAVGTMAGQIIMQGFVRFPIPVWVRRIVTMLPSFVAVAMGVNVTQALVLSQVVLSLVLPIPMIALLILTRRADVMGRSTNGRCIGAAAIVAASVVIGLNILLIVGVCGVALPWPSGLAAEGELTGSFVVPAFLLVAIVALLSVCAGALLARVASSGDGRRASFAAVAARIGGSWGGLAVENARLRSELDQARTAVAAKNRALAAAGHDLMQPVQSIVLCLDRMRRRVTEGRDREQVDRALREAEWLGRALERLNTMSRLDHGAITPNLAVVPIAEMLIDVAATYEGAAEAKRLALRVVPSRLTIRSDRDLLLTILQNFVGNAVKYTAKGGVLVGCRRRGGRVWIEVHDTGIGIPAHQIDAAFEAYRRLSTDGEGLGLGLSIVRHLADLLGHRVAIRSRPGKGSCFAIEVALAEMTGDRR